MSEKLIVGGGNKSHEPFLVEYEEINLNLHKMYSEFARIMNDF